MRPCCASSSTITVPRRARRWPTRDVIPAPRVKAEAKQLQEVVLLPPVAEDEEGVEEGVGEQETNGLKGKGRHEFSSSTLNMAIATPAIRLSGMANYQVICTCGQRRTWGRTSPDHVCGGARSYGAWFGLGETGQCSACGTLATSDRRRAHGKWNSELHTARVRLIGDWSHGGDLMGTPPSTAAETAQRKLGSGENAFLSPSQRHVGNHVARFKTSDRMMLVLLLKRNSSDTIS